MKNALISPATIGQLTRLRYLVVAAVLVLVSLTSDAWAHTRHSSTRGLRKTTPRLIPRPSAPVPASSASAGAPSTIKLLYGQVKDERARPLPGACVFTSHDRRNITVTDAKGEFLLNVTDGPAVKRLVVTYAGLTERQVPVNDGLNEPVYVTLVK